MCQQTTIQAVIPYYTKFLSTWPTIHDLANAPSEDVMAAWAGLGYYARASNLHKCAQVISNDLGGSFPTSYKDLLELPGVGDYTASAIATIVFDEGATVMDGNIERVMSRFFAISDALPKAKPIFKEYTSQFFHGFKSRHGDFAQALMDIGATICTPKKSKCHSCPIQNACKAHQQDNQESFPVKTPKKQRPHKYGEVYWIENDRGEVLFEKRPEKGLLSGMIALPTSSWQTIDKKIEPPEITQDLEFKETNITTDHIFTHFKLTLTLKISINNKKLNTKEGFFWAQPSAQEKSLPTVFKKPFVQYMISYGVD